MKLYAFRVFANDWDRACEFYEHTLDLPVKLKNASMGWAEFDVGGPSLELERVGDDGVEGRPWLNDFWASHFKLMTSRPPIKNCRKGEFSLPLRPRSSTGEEPWPTSRTPRETS